jgi:hypothetical protein
VKLRTNLQELKKHTHSNTHYKKYANLISDSNILLVSALLFPELSRGGKNSLAKDCFSQGSNSVFLVNLTLTGAH